MTEDPPVPLNSIAADALLRELDGPAFAEPWMAEAFACAVHLNRRGLFAWSEWVKVFSDEIKAHPQQPGEEADAAYYRQWLAALEMIVGLKGAASTAEISERQETWRRAYLNTPHGQPVELHHAAAPPQAPHHHHGHHQHGTPEPISVSPARG
jgi:nitrile hydratase accessory protein